MTPQSSSSAVKPAETAPGRAPLQWLTSRLAELRARRPRPTSGLRIPRPARLRAPRTSWWASFWSARLAVRAGIPMADYLRHRLAQRLATLPVPPARLPVRLAVTEGGVLSATPSPSPARRAPWLESFLRAEGPSALAPEIQLAQADVARLAVRIEAQRQRVDQAARELEGATRGDVADPADEAQAQQMGRPRVPHPVGMGLQLLGLALLLAETWQLGLPCLEAIGLRTHDLPGELHRNPVGLVLGALFALGASTSLFLLAHLALGRGLELIAALPEARRRRWTGAAALAAAGLAVALAWSIAGLRPGPGGGRAVDPRYARAAFFLVALAIPICTAWMVRLSRRLEEVRAVALARARAWDQEHYRSYAELSRRAVVSAEEEQRLVRLEADRAAAVRRLRALQQRSLTAERLAADAADEEELDLSRLAQALATALDRDRYEYVRQATARGLELERAEPDLVREPSPAEVRAAHEVQHNLGLAG